MASTALRTLGQRAEQADAIIGNLKQQITFLKQAFANKAAEKIKAENDDLKREVTRLRTELCIAEIQNGVRQYSVPATLSMVTTPTGTTIDQSSAIIVSSTPTEVSDKKIENKGAKVVKKDTKDKTKATKPEKKVTAPADAESCDAVDVSRLEFKVGQIVEVDRHPDADSLYVEKVDLGEGDLRTVVSGLVKHVPIEEMQNRLAMFMCNLKPAKVRGVLSQAMIMCASSPEKTEILDLPTGAVIGDIIHAPEHPGSPDTQLNPKKKIWEQVKPDLRTDAAGIVNYKGAKCVIDGKGEIKAKTVFNGQIS